MHLEELRKPLRNMPLAVFLILIILSTIMSITAYSNAQNQSETKSPTEVNGFLPYAITINNQGKITISKDTLQIEALSGTQPRAIIYASTSDFEWTFSATYLTATDNNDAHPIAFTIDWNFGAVLIFSEPSQGWFYNLRNNTDPSNDPALWYSNGTFFGPNFNLTKEAHYNVDLKWHKLPESVSLFLTISSNSWNETWSKAAIIPIPPKTNIEYSSLYLESWANKTGHALTRFEESKLISHNSQKFTQQTSFGNLVFLFGTLTILVLMVLTLIEKVAQLFSTRDLSIHGFFAQRQSSQKNAGNFFNRNKLLTRRYRIVILLFVFFAILRLLLAASTPGQTFDTHAAAAWVNIFQSKGIFSIFSVSDTLSPFMGLRPVFPYPPVTAYIFGLISSFPAKENITSLIIKLPGIIGDLLLGAVVFIALRKRGYLSIAVPALILSLLNFVNSSIWGQYDSIVALFMILAIWLVATKRIELGWIFMALAVCTKQTSLVILPGLLILSLKQKSHTRLFYGILAFVSVFFIIWYPFIQNGVSPDFALGTSGLRLWAPGGGLDPVAPEGGGGTSIWAFNIWPLITTAFNGQPPVIGLIGGVKDTLPNQFLIFSYFQLGILLFGLSYIILSIRIWKAKSPQDSILYFALILLAFYILPTRVHERYLFFGLSILPLVYNKSKKIIGSYLMLLTTYSLTLAYSLIGGPLRSRSGILSPVLEGVFSDNGLLLICAINTAVFLLLMAWTSKTFTHLANYFSKKKVQGLQ
jgi:Gpi18-like mannosyltransferase